MKLAKQYFSKNPAHFPADDIPEFRKKDPEYFRQCALTILSKYLNNHCFYPYQDTDQARSIRTLRNYATGKNSSDKYKDIMVGHVDPQSGQRRRTSYNISWGGLQVLPEKLDVVTGFFQKTKYDSIISSIDYQAVASKQAILATHKLMANDKFRLMQTGLNELMGTQVANNPEMPDGAVNGPIQMNFSNEQQVDQFAAVGGVFLSQEAAMTNLLDKTNLESNNETLEDMVKRDLTQLGFAGIRIHTDRNGYIVKKDYWDPERAIIPNTSYLDFRDMTWAGEIKNYTISRLRSDTDISDISLIEIARKYATYDGYDTGEFYRTAYNWKNNNYGFDERMLDQIEVDVVDVRWVGTTTEVYSKVQRRRENNTVFNKVRDDYRLSPKDEKEGKTLNTYSRQVIYKAKLIVGTDDVFDFGIDEYLSYKKDLSGKVHVVFPYRAMSTGTSSLVERAIPYVDDANLSTFKLRHAKKKMPTPPNLVIKKSALENVKIGDKVWTPVELVRMMQEEGFTVVDDQNQWGEKNNNGMPIWPIPTDIVKQLAEWRADIDWNIMMIERVTGINEIFSAQTPSSETGLGVSRIALNATSNALYPIMFAFNMLKAGAERSAMNKWQVVAKYIPEKERERLSVNRDLQYVKIGTDLDKFEFDLKLEVAPTEDDKLQLLQDIARMRDLRRQAGTGGILPSDYMLIFNMIKTDKVRQAQVMLAQIEELRGQEDARREKELVDYNTQQQQASAQLGAQNQAQLMQAEADLDLRNTSQQEILKANLQMRNERLKAQEDRKNTALQNVYGWGNGSYSRPNR